MSNIPMPPVRLVQDDLEPTVAVDSKGNITVGTTTVAMIVLTDKGWKIFIDKRFRAQVQEKVSELKVPTNKTIKLQVRNEILIISIV